MTTSVYSGQYIDRVYKINVGLLSKELKLKKQCNHSEAGCFVLHVQLRPY